MLEYFV